MKTHKKCSDCAQDKPIKEFDRRNDRLNSYLAYCKECRRIRQNKANSTKENKIKNSRRNKSYYAKNKQGLLVKSKAWRDEFKKENGFSYNTLKKRADIQYRLRQNVRKRLRAILISSIRTTELIGCSLKELKNILEYKFQPGMTWNNYGVGGWEIDHIIPLKSFDLTNPEELKKACHYSNLQPLWASDNRKKSANKEECYVI